ncbi:hypothetical protein M406DRAFT_339885 [Cryphonectria parasitica EP155]|uniref:C2H2-type domain-containing protein n=1 Tax=Cryphonectria parasitica (strain ATCC 38755 / EP155) TaxID=660469 RepID=A0A9P4Y142_CRYP1|nr:uncharacterized protein M406DRAFT_339885 [Cryphonectria parasitica EP155]KAF3764220.1 hypothetical protein M406DRAFT_339885 [Cryphonectria parasitica EP155]
MSNPNSIAAFEQARREFVAELKIADRQEFQNATRENVHSEIDKIQARLMRQRRGKNLTRLKSFLEAIDQFGKVIEVFGNASLFVAFLWIASSWTDALDDLVGVYEKIGDSFSQYLQLEGLFEKDADMLKYLVLIYKDILRFHQQALRYFQQPLLKQLLQATWKTYKTRFDPIVDDIERHSLRLQVQTTTSHIRNESRQLRAIIVEQEGQRLRDLYQWLRSPTNGAQSSIDNDHHHYRTLCDEDPENNRWLLEKRAFREWIEPISLMKPPLLWINGIPGAGKTILASSVIEEVKKSHPQSTVLFFYCKQDNSERNSFSCIARHFLAESLRHNHDLLLPIIYDQFSKSTEPILDRLKDIEELLRTAVLNCPCAHIVIDGIDECPREDRKMIVQWFRKLVEDVEPQEQHRIRCLFVSQDDGIARKDFSGLAMLKIEPADNSRDIKQFSFREASRIQSAFDLDVEMTATIASKIQSSAGGMFLLAKLIVSNLLQQTTVEEIEKELEDENLPKELYEAYSRILLRVFDQASDSQKAATHNLLQWLVCSRRTMKWYEIQSAKAIHVEHQLVDWNRRRYRVSSKDLCGSLVQIRDDTTVDFVHNTARIRIDKTAAHLAFASLSIDYLNMPDFSQDFEVNESVILAGYYGFMEYAVACWLRHLEAWARENEEGDPEIDGLAEALEVFLGTHLLPAMSKQAVPVSKGNERTLEPFQKYDFFQDLQRAVIQLRKELTFFGEMKDRETPLDLTNIVSRLRTRIENVYTDLAALNETKRLVEIYGPNLFKCSRLSCRYFYDGFATAFERDRHLDRHERPFRCTVLGCLSYSMGFDTQKKLDNHMRQTHRRLEDDEDAFPNRNDIFSEKQAPVRPPEKRPRSPTRGEGNAYSSQTLTAKKPRITEWHCPYCEKVFKKKFNMTNHVRIHSDERAFVCGTCPSSFTRESDLKRHEKNHAPREHICEGCGSKFARSDTLRDHHRSETGKACLSSLSQGQSGQNAIHLQQP